MEIIMIIAIDSFVYLHTGFEYWTTGILKYNVLKTVQLLIDLEDI
jgi:hypothetical protein